MSKEFAKRRKNLMRKLMVNNTAGLVKYALRNLRKDGGELVTGKVADRLEEMEELLGVMDRLMNKFLESEKKSKTMLGFFKGIMSM